MADPGHVRLREVTEADSGALAELVARSPDAGLVSFAPRYHAPLIEAVRCRQPSAVGVVAETADSELVGAAWLSFGRCRVQGREIAAALPHGLVVHPDHRRHGVARDITRWLMQRVDDHGSDTLVMAGIQRGNLGSRANAAAWATQMLGRIVVAPVPTTARRHDAATDALVRLVRHEELEQLADCLGAFYRDYDLSTPRDAPALAAWLDQRTPLGTPLNSYVVAVGGSGRLLAGVGIQDEAQLVSLHITRMPQLVRLANLAVKVVPKDGTMRNLQAKMMWFAPGQLHVVRQMWQSLRRSLRDRGTSIVVTMDHRSPLRQVLQNPPWLPTTSLSVAVRTAQRLDESRLLAPEL